MLLVPLFFSALFHTNSLTISSQAAAIYAKKTNAKKSSSAQKNSKAKKNSKGKNKNACLKSHENLIVVNFGVGKLTLYINDKKSGTVPSQDQKKFKQVLPSGNAVVKLARGSELIHEEIFAILSQGKASCKLNKVIIIK